VRSCWSSRAEIGRHGPSAGLYEVRGAIKTIFGASPKVTLRSVPSIRTWRSDKGDAKIPRGVKEGSSDVVVMSTGDSIIFLIFFFDFDFQYDFLVWQRSVAFKSKGLRVCNKTHAGTCETWKSQISWLEVFFFTKRKARDRGIDSITKQARLIVCLPNQFTCNRK
jgi:hypothetical protein